MDFRDELSKIYLHVQVEGIPKICKIVAGNIVGLNGFASVICLFVVTQCV